MRVLAKGGVLGKKNRDWRNIAEHCLAEAVGADILAEHLGADREKVTRASLVHDWYKRKEIESMRLVGGAQGYLETSEEDIRLLTEYGVPEDIIQLAHANIPQSAELDYIKNRSREEKIVHFIDMITDGSRFVEHDERLKIVVQKKHNIDFSELFRRRYNGKSLFELQQEVTIQEKREFEQTIGLATNSLIPFIVNKLKERITKD